MTRKDYIALANAIRRARGACETINQERGVERAMECVADVLASDNDHFDRARFIAASRFPEQSAVSRG